MIIKEGCPGISGCGNCKAVCPVSAVEDVQTGLGVKFNDQCIECGVCAAACPVKLIAPGKSPALPAPGVSPAADASTVADAQAAVVPAPAKEPAEKPGKAKGVTADA